MNKIEHKDRILIERKNNRIYVDGVEYAPVDKSKFAERVKGVYYISTSGSIYPGSIGADRNHYNDWAEREFAELVSADQRRRYAMWQAVYMFDPESKGRGKFSFYKSGKGKWVYLHANLEMPETNLGVSSHEAAQNCIDWLTEQGV